jgi:hypothetical protein
VVAGHVGKPRRAIALTAHDHAPVRQFLHGSDGQPAAPVEEFALVVGQLFPQTRRVIENTAVQQDVLTARNDLQRVELQVLDRAHRLLRALTAAPAPPRPQTLLAEDKPAGRIDVDGQHIAAIITHFPSPPRRGARSEVGFAPH